MVRAPAPDWPGCAARLLVFRPRDAILATADEGAPPPPPRAAPSATPPLPPRLSAEEERHELDWEDAVTDRRFLAHVRAGGGGVRTAAEVDDDDEEGDTLEGMLAQSRARGRERGGRGARGRPRRY